MAWLRGWMGDSSWGRNDEGNSITTLGGGTSFDGLCFDPFDRLRGAKLRVSGAFGGAQDRLFAGTTVGFPGFPHRAGEGGFQTICSN